MKFLRTFFHVFPSSMRDSRVLRYYESRYQTYSNNYIEPLSSFLGLPNSHALGTDLTWSMIAKKFFGWEGGPLYKSFFWLTTIYHLVSMLLTIPANILRLVTEFIPHLMVSLGEDLEAKNGDDIIGAYGTLLRWFFIPIYFIGQAITSPAKAILTYFDVALKTKGFASLGYIALMIASLLVTTAFYSICLPLGIKLLAATVFPALPTLLTTMMGPLLPIFNAVGTGIVVALFGSGSSFMLPLASFVGLTAINTVLSTLTKVGMDALERGTNLSNRIKVFLMRIGQEEIGREDSRIGEETGLDSENKGSHKVISDGLGLPQPDKQQNGDLDDKTLHSTDNSNASDLDISKLFNDSEEDLTPSPFKL